MRRWSYQAYSNYIQQWQALTGYLLPDKILPLWTENIPAIMSELCEGRFALNGGCTAPNALLARCMRLAADLEISPAEWSKELNGILGKLQEEKAVVTQVQRLCIALQYSGATFVGDCGDVLEKDVNVSLLVMD